MSGFSTTLPGLGEARMTGLRDYLRSKVSDLNTTLQLTPLSLPTGLAVSGSIIIGDPARIAKEAAFKLCVLGAGRDSGLDLETEIWRVGVGYSTSTFKNTLHTRLRLYLSPFLFPVASGTVSEEESQCEKRELFLQRVTDWLRADCFQVAGGTNIILASKEYGNTVNAANPTGGDFLQRNEIVSSTLARFQKSYGGEEICTGAEIQIVSCAQ